MGKRRSRRNRAYNPPNHPPNSTAYATADRELYAMSDGELNELRAQLRKELDIERAIDQATGNGPVGVLPGQPDLSQRAQFNNAALKDLAKSIVTNAAAKTGPAKQSLDPRPLNPDANNPPSNTKEGGWYSQEPPPLLGGRQTQPVNPALFDWPYSFMPRKSWQGLDLADIRDTRSVNPQQLLDKLSDLSPEVSLAVWNVLRMVNTEWKYEVRTPDNTAELTKGKQMLDMLIPRINKRSGGLNNLIYQWVFTLYLQGAAASELVIAPNRRQIDDIVAVQPWTIYFQRDMQQKLIPFQAQTLTYKEGSIPGEVTPGAVGNFPFKRLNETTFSYVPMDPAVDDPYGRSPAAPVLQLIMFDIQFMKDLRQSVHMSAWGRLHLQAVEELLLKNAPAAVRNDPQGDLQIAYITRRLRRLQVEYESLGPDDAFMSTDAFNLKPIDFSSGMAQIDTVCRLIERRIFRSLKQLPVLMGSNEGTTETHGTVQMEIYAKGIQSIQRIIGSILENLLEVALQFYGIDAKVIWEFEAVRGTNRMQDAQAQSVEDQNLAFQVQQAWRTNDDAAIKSTGSKAVPEAKSITFETAKAQMEIAKSQAVIIENQAAQAAEQTKTAPQQSQLALQQQKAATAQAMSGAVAAKHQATMAGHQVIQSQSDTNLADEHAKAKLQTVQAQADATTHGAKSAELKNQMSQAELKNAAKYARSNLQSQQAQAKQATHQANQAEIATKMAKLQHQQAVKNIKKQDQADREAAQAARNGVQQTLPGFTTGGNQPQGAGSAQQQGQPPQGAAQPAQGQGQPPAAGNAPPAQTGGAGQPPNTGQTGGQAVPAQAPTGPNGVAETEPIQAAKAVAPVSPTQKKSPLKAKQPVAQPKPPQANVEGDKPPAPASPNPPRPSQTPAPQAAGAGEPAAPGTTGSNQPPGSPGVPRTKPVKPVAPPKVTALVPKKAGGMGKIEFPGP
jgi:membrane protein involved in colicin uptake